MLRLELVADVATLVIRLATLCANIIFLLSELVKGALHIIDDTFCGGSPLDGSKSGLHLNELLCLLDHHIDILEACLDL